jgi:hypothetical protein
VPFMLKVRGVLAPSFQATVLPGHEKGAFTDAKDTRQGHFEQANNGTLFLDEIGDMPLDMQTRLLRALEERRIRLLGGTNDIAVDVRIVSATDRNLLQAATEGAFREDLLYRLNTVTLTLPPLRERPDDIQLLAKHFVTQYAHETGKSTSSLTPEDEKDASIQTAVVVLEIEDNGAGMDEEAQAHISEPFFTTKDADKGTGLGLSISYSIVRNHSGTIACDSKKGEGTTFRVELPAT